MFVLTAQYQISARDPSELTSIKWAETETELEVIM